MSGHAGNQNFIGSIKDGLVFYLDATSSLVSSSYGYVGNNVGWNSVVGCSYKRSSGNFNYTSSYSGSVSLNENGNGNYIMYNSTTQTNTLRNFTLCVWANYTGGGSFFDPFLSNGGDSGARNCQFGLYTNDNRFAMSSDFLGDFYTPSGLAVNGIHFWTVTFQGGSPSSINLYKDGVSIYSTTTTNVLSDITGTQLRIGEDFCGHGFHGTISFVQVYNRALSSSEIESLYSGSKGRFGL